MKSLAHSLGQQIDVHWLLIQERLAGLSNADDRKILLLPAWPRDWDVHFKLHAPYQTTVEGVVKGGKLEKLVVLPAERAKDVEVGSSF